MENIIVILLVAVLIAILSSENHACKNNGKFTLKAAEIAADSMADNEIVMEDEFSSDTVRRFLEWRYKLGRRQPSENQGEIDYTLHKNV